MTRWSDPMLDDNGSGSGADVLARSLGWFSIGLGLTELVVARTFCRVIGLDGQETLLRACGVREVAIGVAILGSRAPEPWIWGRVAGDALDLATVASAIRSDNPKEPSAIAAIGVLAGVTLLDVLCATALSHAKGPVPHAVSDYRDRSGFPQGLAAARRTAGQPVLATAAAEQTPCRNESAAERQDRRLDEALEETFPGSDPISLSRIT